MTMMSQPQWMKKLRNSQNVMIGGGTPAGGQVTLSREFQLQSPDNLKMVMANTAVGVKAERPMPGHPPDQAPPFMCYSVAVGHGTS